ncbi:putative rRNA methylase-domain-containing protein, partial [Ochromonadaceae sp. CCMP2298]
IPMTQNLWRAVVRPGDIVIDATCGRGSDSLFLAQLAVTPTAGRIYCIDIQEAAVQHTRERFAAHEVFAPLLDDRVNLLVGSHETLPAEIQPSSVSLICYNLGYLPGKDRTSANEITTITTPETTVRSLRAALPLLREGGLLSVVAYPMHLGGTEEMQQVQQLLAQLTEDDWRVYSNPPLNRPMSPTL